MCITSITAEQVKHIDQATKGQTANKYLFKERTKPLQSSNLGKICTSADRTDLPKLADCYTVVKQFKSDATDHGITNEATAIHQYEQESCKTVGRCGIHVRTTKPYLACSPGGLIGEVKCPYSSKDQYITPVTVPYLYMNDDPTHKSLYLLKGHPYYYLIQGTMFWTNRKHCDLVVWTFKEMQTLKVPRDKDFFESIIPKLDKFFVDHFPPAFLQRYFYRYTSGYAFSR